MTTTCDNCGEPCGPEDLFCERCGYDFITGSLPASATTSPAPASAAPTAPSAAPDSTGAEAVSPVPSLVDATGAIPRVLVTVATDKAFFEAMVTEGEVALPDPPPPEQELELFGQELHIGRTSEGRGVHPNIDVEALTGDPAVSTRHAVLRVANDGSHTITDVGSTNGTFIDDFSGEPVIQGVPVPVDESTVIYLGAWTRLTARPG